MGFNSISANPIQRDMYEREVLFVYAVIETGGKQYKVQAGDTIFVEKLAVEADATVDFKVILLDNDGDVKVGAPYVEGASVSGKVLKNGKSKKIVVFKYRPKKDSKSLRGHRQPYTKVQIEKISV